MKKCVMCIGAVALMSLAAGAVCVMGKKPKKSGIRHAAERLLEGVNDFLDDIGMW